MKNDTDESKYMKRWHKKYVLWILFMVLVYALYQSVSHPLHTTSPHIAPLTSQKPTESFSPAENISPQKLPKTARGPFPVERVIDGDTIKVSTGSTSETIRFIGINTPETVRPGEPVECFGKEASEETKKLLTGKPIYLETDSSQDIYDKYGRLLAYVFLEDGTNINEELVRYGYAYEYTYYLPYKYQKLFKEAESDAQRNQRGLWGSDVCPQKNKNY